MSTSTELVQSFIGEGGRIFRRRQGLRTITVAYRVVDGVLVYGATIHRQEVDPKSGRKVGQSFTRRAHNTTAVIRATKSPITVPDVSASTEKIHPSVREDYLRECLMKFGCRAKETSKDDSAE